MHSRENHLICLQLKILFEQSYRGYYTCRMLFLFLVEYTYTHTHAKTHTYSYTALQQWPSINASLQSPDLDLGSLNHY